MNYFINIIITILIFFSNILSANDNKIIFEINNKIYTSLDLEYRINYLEEINRTKYSSNLEEELKETTDNNTEIRNDLYKNYYYLDKKLKFT